MQRICGACESQAGQECPSLSARALPSTRERYWAAVVKKEEPSTSSQRSGVCQYRISGLV